jgi:hypothetical protein
VKLDIQELIFMQSQNGWCWLCSNNPNFMHPMPGSPLLPVVTFSAQPRDRMRAKTVDFITIYQAKA